MSSRRAGRSHHITHRDCKVTQQSLRRRRGRPPHADAGRAAYMGHQKYSSTAWYVHLLPERLAATGLTRAAGIIPAVTS